MITTSTSSQVAIASATNAISKDEDSGSRVLAGGSIAGVVIGSVIALALLALLALLLLRRRRQASPQNGDGTMPPPESYNEKDDRKIMPGPGPAEIGSKEVKHRLGELEGETNHRGELEGDGSRRGELEGMPSPEQHHAYELPDNND